VARCRTAKQFEQFQGEKHLYPNLEWPATRSADPRELHLTFVGTVLPIDDPFWQENQPGNLYNCKCDWQTTDKEVSTTPAKSVKPSIGLEGNPASTGEIFTDKHPYIAKQPKLKNSLKEVVYNDSKANFPISVIAHKGEIADNVATARILLKNFPDMKIAIREHVLIKGIKNPEYMINGMIADAKRIENYEGISWSFRSAIEQNCKIVIIDMNKHFNTAKKIDLNKIKGRIMWREKDFNSNKIIECYFVFGNNSCLIKKEDLTKHKLMKILKGLMP